MTGDEMPGSFDMGTGFVASISGSRRWSLGARRRWFVTGSLTGSGGTTTTSGVSSERFTAFDLRVGAIAGRTFADRISPYVLARGFGGPVMWNVGGSDVTGSDTHHYQLGVGTSVTTGFGLSGVIDVSLLGEQAVSIGLSWRL